MVWPFSQPPGVDLTEESYARWLRAQRPTPMSWFLGQPAEVQETLAMMGDEYVQDLAVAVGYAIRDPELAAAGLDAGAGDLDAEETLARRLASELAGRILQGRQAAEIGPQAAPARPPMTMAGVGERRAARKLARRKAEDAGRSFLGGRPDDPDGGGPG